jgi:hypothetical protein
MGKSCVIFSCTILNRDRLFVLHQFITEFKESYSDCDIYVGINYNSISEVEDVLVNSGLSIIYQRSTEELYTFSDASAYQMALKLLKFNNKQYTNYWFVHTKGSVNSHSDYLRGWYIENLIKRRTHIEKFLDDNSGIGSYGILGLEYNITKTYDERDEFIPLSENVLTAELPYTHINLFYIHTLYVIRNVCISKFLEIIPDVWFDTKLNRYYFEGVFPFIVSRMGYYQYLSNSKTMNGIDTTQIYTNWIYENNLIEHIPYLNLYNTNFNFNQLNPPYYIL